MTLATPQPYSRLRLRTMGRELDLDLDAVRIATLEQATRDTDYDWSVVMNNEVLPNIPGQAKRNIFLCQFPFPASDETLAQRWDYADDYERTVVYSRFALDHYARAVQQTGKPLPLITVVYPPCPAPRLVATAKKPMILGVGRFFVEGHAKRQDLMIQAFKTLHATHPEASLHLVGSLPPDPACHKYLLRLRRQAEGLPVFFHINAAAPDLAQLYASASLYWHLAGYGVEQALTPHRCEHFGGTVVEAMAAGCIPLVVNRGGPAEIVGEGEAGLVFEDLDKLVALSDRLLSLPAEAPELETRRQAAVTASRRYTPERFAEAFLGLLGFDRG